MLFNIPNLNGSPAYLTAHKAVWQAFISCRRAMAKHGPMGFLEEISTAK